MSRHSIYSSDHSLKFVNVELHVTVIIYKIYHTLKNFSSGGTKQDVHVDVENMGTMYCGYKE